MGVEFRILRHDNKTIFDLGKSYGDSILNYVFSQEELLEYLLVYQLQLWDRTSSSICSLIIRDRLLDFVEGAGIADLEVVMDHWFEDGDRGYTFTHNRYIGKEDLDKYWDALQMGDGDDYRHNPLVFYKKSGISNGK